MKKRANKIYSKKNKEILEKTDELLVGYLPVGYPDSQSFFGIIEDCEKAGVDIFEFGYPPQNAFADGEVIRRAYEAVDYEKVKNINYWRKIRTSISTPIWIMGYAQDLVPTGEYLRLAEAGVVDGFVIPDIDIDVYIELCSKLQQHNVDVVCFVKNDATDLSTYFRQSSLVYYQLVNGITGSSCSTDIDFSKVIEESKTYKDLYILGGFGISTGEQACHVISSGFDGVIIGTEMLRKLNESPSILLSFIKNIKQSMKSMGELNIE